MKTIQMLREFLIFCIALLGVDIHEFMGEEKKRKVIKVAGPSNVGLNSTAQEADVLRTDADFSYQLGSKEIEEYLWNDGDSRAG